MKFIEIRRMDRKELKRELGILAGGLLFYIVFFYAFSIRGINVKNALALLFALCISDIIVVQGEVARLKKRISELEALKK